MSSADAQQASSRAYQQFIQLMPLTLNIAGLPPSDLGKYLSEDQMDLRARSIRNAYKVARKLVKEVVKES